MTKKATDQSTDARKRKRKSVAPRKPVTKPSDSNLTRVISFRLSDEDASAFEAKCEASGLSKSELFRAAIFGYEEAIDSVAHLSRMNTDYAAAEEQIRRAGNNINQIAHALNRAALEGSMSDQKAVAAMVLLARVDQNLRAILEV